MNLLSMIKLKSISNAYCFIYHIKVTTLRMSSELLSEHGTRKRRGGKNRNFKVIAFVDNCPSAQYFKNY